MRDYRTEEDLRKLPPNNKLILVYVLIVVFGGVLAGVCMEIFNFPLCWYCGL